MVDEDVLCLRDECHLYLPNLLVAFCHMFEHAEKRNVSLSLDYGKRMSKG